MWYLIIPAAVVIGGWLWGASKVASNAPPIAPPILVPIPPNAAKLGMKLGDFVLMDPSVAFNPNFPVPGLDVKTPVRYSVDSFDVFGDLNHETFLGRAADPQNRVSKAFQSILPYSKIVLVEKT